MLSRSVRQYCNRWGIIPGKKISIYTNNDDGWITAKDLKEAGCNVVMVIDERSDIVVPIKNVDYRLGKKVVDTKGSLRISSLRLDDGTTVETDCLAVSGGFNPNVHLTCHERGRPQWQEKNQCNQRNQGPKKNDSKS